MSNLITHRIKVVTPSGEYEHSYTAITDKCYAVESASTDDRASASSEAAARNLIYRAVTKQDRAAVNSLIRARAFAAIVLIDYITRRAFTWAWYAITCWSKPKPAPIHTAAQRMSQRMCAEERVVDPRAAWQRKMEAWLAAHPRPATLSA